MTSKSSAAALVRTKTTVTVVSRKKLLRHTQVLVDSIAQRAYELYGNRGHEADGDLGDWIRPESELLTTLRIEIFDVGEYVIARAAISGLDAHDVTVCVEPSILRIVGTPKKLVRATASFWESDSERSKQFFHAAELPHEVDATRATAIVTDLMLEIVTPKATKAKKIGDHARCIISGSVPIAVCHFRSVLSPKGLASYNK